MLVVICIGLIFLFVIWPKLKTGYSEVTDYVLSDRVNEVMQKWPIFSSRLLCFVIAVAAWALGQNIIFLIFPEPLSLPQVLFTIAVVVLYLSIMSIWTGSYRSELDGLLLEWQRQIDSRFLIGKQISTIRTLASVSADYLRLLHAQIDELNAKMACEKEDDDLKREILIRQNRIMWMSAYIKLRNDRPEEDLEMYEQIFGMKAQDICKKS